MERRLIEKKERKERERKERGDGEVERWSSGAGKRPAEDERRNTEKEAKEGFRVRSWVGGVEVRVLRTG